MLHAFYRNQEAPLIRVKISMKKAHSDPLEKFLFSEDREGLNSKKFISINMGAKSTSFMDNLVQYLTFRKKGMGIWVSE